MNRVPAKQKPHRSISAPAPARRGVIHLEYVNPSAQSVYIAGAFNDWHPSVTEMLKADGGRWIKELALPPGNYEYRFVVDGKWVTDPNCRAAMANPFGSYNSVITIPQLKS